MNDVFTKEDTSIAKGIAICLLLFHHLFYAASAELYQPIYVLRGITIEADLALQAKVCVTIFTILSGYGLSESVKNRQGGGMQKWNEKYKFVLKHLLKIMEIYWFIYGIFFIAGITLGFLKLSHIYHNIAEGLLDIAGLSGMFGTPTINGTWWYMSAIIMLYLLFPVLHMSIKKFPLFTLILSAFPWVWSIIPNGIWILSFTIGMIMSQYGVLNKIVKNKKKKDFILFSVGGLIIGTLLRRIYGIEFDIIYSIIFLILSICVISKWRLLKSILGEIGKVSSFIFMSHSFFLIYGKSMIYAPKYSILIFIWCILISYLAAFLLKTMYYGMRKRIIKEKT